MSSHAYVSRMVRYRPLGMTGPGADLAAMVTRLDGAGLILLTTTKRMHWRF